MEASIRASLQFLRRNNQRAGEKENENVFENSHGLRANVCYDKSGDSTQGPLNHTPPTARIHTNNKLSYCYTNAPVGSCCGCIHTTLSLWIYLWATLR